MSKECTYCSGIRLVGWSGAGPILCPECSRGEDAFTVVTAAWREQRKMAVKYEHALRTIVNTGAPGGSIVGARGDDHRCGWCRGMLTPCPVATAAKALEAKEPGQ